ncbi:e3 ubiquitin-protein ligase HERC2 [Caerostris extrusa]|uniref:E3 ubiquitin-protein ligase HERC2 n=1 Tax=Caerostris extrusa TaxID=172846 RepID=A0AAV4T6K9_CAEEX|nr:e3 ubiquitin-protein ligase HERC2 [Caerostris extrusa]
MLIYHINSDHNLKVPASKFHLDDELASDKMLDVWAALLALAVGDDSCIENKCKTDQQAAVVPSSSGSYLTSEVDFPSKLEVIISWLFRGKKKWLIFLMMIVPPFLKHSQILILLQLMMKNDALKGFCSGKFENVFCNRGDFQSELDYTFYMAENLHVGSLVRCCLEFQDLKKGDIGVVVHDDPGSYNVQVEWKRVGKTYWMRYKYLEFLHPLLQVDQNPVTNQCCLEVGDQVRVKLSVSTPFYKWGGITHDCVGVVRGFKSEGQRVIVDFLLI